MASSMYEHEYPLDNDSEETRLQNQHEVIKDAMGGLVWAPIDFTKAPLRVLDSGTSDGAWIQDIAQSSSSITHELYGTDIKPAAFPASPAKGMKFQVQDINKPWPEDWQGRFDFVHQRLVLIGGGANQKQAVESLAALVKPGGWIQLIEGVRDITSSCGPIMHDFIGSINSMMKFFGCDPDFSSKLGGWLKGAGFVDITDREVQVKFGALNPDAGLARRGVLSTSTAAKGLAEFFKTLPPDTINLSVERLNTFGEDVRNELITKGGIYPLRVVWARKP